MSDVETPATEAEAAEIVREAHSAARAMEIRGGGTRGGLGRPTESEFVLSTAGLDGVSLYDPGALTLVARAGARLSDLEQALAAEKQRLPFEPMDHRSLLGSTGEPTIGAVAACNVSGPRRVQAGACRDSLLGVRFVDGRGEIVKSGGRVMKNVTGLDLGKLMCGAFGTLGVLTEVAFKLSPTPERSGTVMVRGLSVGDAVALMSAALGTPFEVNGAAHAPDFDGGPATALRVEGLEKQFAYRVERLSAALRPHLSPGSEIATLDGADHDALWRDIRDVRSLADKPGAVWRISVRPSAAPSVVDGIARRVPARFQLDWGGGLIWASTPEDGDACEAIVRAAVREAGGHATLARASAEARAQAVVFEPESPRLAQISRQLRDTFDPAGILNRGRMAEAVA